MYKVRTFQKELEVENFQLVTGSTLKKIDLNTAPKHKVYKETAQILAEVFYNPKGWRSDIRLLSPTDVWEFNHTCVLLGCSEDYLDGDLQEKNFNSLRSAMQFLTRRLKRLGWVPIDSWHSV